MKKTKTKDMYLPNWVCALGIMFLAAGIVCVVNSFTISLYSIIGSVFCFPLGIAAILCWKNQWAKMLNNYEFVYSTMFGKQYQYHFSEIKGLQKNADSITLLMQSGKVHIESCALCSERFINRINDILSSEQLRNCL